MTLGDQFVEKFFRAAGQHTDWERSLEHFKAAFVEPPRFEILLNDLKPVAGHLKVVVVDGHPRSGKSWAVIKALQSIVDELELKPEECWTAGIDSLSVFPNSKDDLKTGALRVQEQLNSTLRLVLLDDFLGTNQLRLPGESIYDQQVGRFLQWDRQNNPWLQRMTDNSVIVVTGRCLHFMLLEILLGICMRKSNIDSANRLIVINSRRGLFRTIDKVPFGAFDPNTLHRVCENNRKYHPLKDEDPDWFVVATPLIAFDDSIPRAGTQEKHAHPELTPHQKQLAASGLFGEDIDSIAETIKTVETLNSEEKNVKLWQDATLGQLYKAYLVTIAPGLLFLDRAAYSQLGLDDEIKDLVVTGLYLSERIEEFCSGRLPNEFYMIALNDHFKNYLELAAKAFAHVVNPEGQRLTDARKIPGLGLRGFLERGLHNKRLGSSQNPLLVGEFTYLLERFSEFKPDCLLHLERGESPSNRCGVKMNPGLAAAMGWVLNNFYQPTDETVRQYVCEWIPDRFRYLTKELDASAKTWMTDPLFDESVRDQGPLPDFYRSKRSVIAAYSAFLQWVIRLDASPRTGWLIDSFIASHEDLNRNGVIQKELRTIIEDQLIWAIGEMHYPLEESSSTKNYLDFLYKNAGVSNRSSSKDKYMQVNRLFSLAWHNRWMEKGDAAFRENATQWIESNRNAALDQLDEDPALLDDNLEYHWFHFIAQRAVWMRDWCFSDDPNEFERNYSQITEGSSRPEHNELFWAIINRVLKAKSINKERIRNVLMLSGTRAARIMALPELIQTIERLTDGNDSSVESRRGVLQAIFELARQGFFEDYANMNTTLEFRIWSRDKYRSLQSEIKDAWDPYWDGLSLMTHLDLLPRQVEGWLDVVPKNWQPIDV